MMFQRAAQQARRAAIQVAVDPRAWLLMCVVVLPQAANAAGIVTDEQCQHFDQLVDLCFKSFQSTLLAGQPTTDTAECRELDTQPHDIQEACSAGNPQVTFSLRG